VVLTARKSPDCEYDNTDARAPARRRGIESRMKECPLCGETMRLTVREIQERVPGVSTPTTRVSREWICPECDYFEEAETGEG
jgi:uncharacterized protein with PIN domain